MDRFFTETFFKFFFGFAAIIAIVFGITILVSHLAPQNPEIETENLANPAIPE